MGLLRRGRGRRKPRGPRSAVEVIALHSLTERGAGDPRPALPKVRERAARRGHGPSAA